MAVQRYVACRSFAVRVSQAALACFLLLQFVQIWLVA